MPADSMFCNSAWILHRSQQMREAEMEMLEFEAVMLGGRINRTNRRQAFGIMRVARRRVRIAYLQRRSRYAVCALYGLLSQRIFILRLCGFLQLRTDYRVCNG